MKNLAFCFVLVCVLAFPAYSQGKKPTASQKKPTASQKKPDATQQKQEEAQKYFETGVSKVKAKKSVETLIEAVKDFDKTIELKPNFAEAYYWRGRARLGFFSLVPSNSKKAAIQILFKDFDKAIELKPNYAEAYIIRAAFWQSEETFAEGVGDLDKAMQDCEKGIKLNSKLGAGYYTRGSIKQKQQKLGEALADYDKAVQFISSVTAPYLLYYNRGVIKDSLKDYRGAIQEYTKAISFEPNYAPSYLNRGTAKFYLKDISACDDWSKACSLGNGIGCNNIAQFCQR